MLLAIDEIHRLGSSLLESENPLELRFGMDTHTALVEAANETGKDCEYQERRRRDLFCRAVHPPEGLTDPTSHDATGRTSRLACETICTLPDSRFLCSGFMHVAMFMPVRWPPYPQLGPRVCDAGHDDLIMNEEAKCIPGGHSCWHRVLDLGVATTRPIEPPLALLEAIDFLSVVWNEKFKTGRLMQSLGTAPPGSLMLPCSSRDEFKSRLSDLSDIFKMFAIDDSLLSDPKAIKKDQTWNRIKEVAKNHLPAAEADRVEAAADRLRWIVAMRTGLQHGAISQDTRKAAAAIGLQWPATDWSAAWDHVRGVALEDLRELRQAIDIP